ncbi:uncharacterized protein V1513DRAFT_466294 [Lipomyces chichibuensis]|uniref:uncharacterized protein n=1 Tax=Lipomyces chichibuensis TaxID=1546026 RepID=UPI003343A41D
MSCLSPAPPRGLQAVIPIDPPPSKREKVARYLQQKKEQFDQYQKLLNQQRQQLLKQRQREIRDERRRYSTSSTNPAKFYRLLSSTSFTSFARAQQTTQSFDPSASSHGAASSAASNEDNESTSSSKAKLLNDKDGEKLVMFPSYARRLESGLVEVDIRGWVFAPGIPNRKNRLFTSVVRQLVGVPAPVDGPESTAQPQSSMYIAAGRGSEDSVLKNASAISVSSVLSSGRSSSSPSRRGSSVGYNNARLRSESPASSTVAMNIPGRSPSRALSRSDTRNSEISYSPSSPGYNSYAAFGTTPNSFGRGASPRRDTYSSAAQQARRLGVMPDDASGAVINNRNFVQPTLVGERQPLLTVQSSKKKGYLTNMDSESESDYYSDSDDDEVVDNQQTFVVERRSSPAKSFTATTPKPTLNGITTNIRHQQSFYANRFNGSSVSIAGHNSEVVAANSDNAPLASSPTANSMASYFPNFGRSGSNLNLHRAFSMSGGTQPTPGPLKTSVTSKDQQNVPPPLPPRPKLISFASIYNPEKSLQERIAPFISRPIAQEAVTIHVGSTETEEYSTYNVITTDSGHFGVRLRLAYEPAISCVECGEDLITVEEVNIIEQFGVSLISDIDDTIKHTGITGAKKGIFKNVFVKDYAELEIKGVGDWYQRLSKIGVPIHYVSNSPWQLYPSIAKFLRKAGLPTGSVHLKHYNGFLYGLLEPAVERKRFNLESILVDFPYRKFILVGDSGEMDLEAYVNLACEFPDQVLAIYIRDVTTSCSDEDDSCTISELNGFFMSSVPRPDEIDGLLADNSGWCCCTGNQVDSKYYHRPHSPPPLMPKPQKLRTNKVTTDAPEPTSTEWISTPAGSSPDTQLMSHKVPKVPEKPSNLKSHPVGPVAAPAPSRPGSDFDLLSSSAASTVSPLAARLAAFSSTFDESGGSPEGPSYLSAKSQQNQMLMKDPPKHNGSGNFNGKHLLSGSISNYNSISNASAAISLPKKDVSFSIDHQNKKPPLPPRPTNIVHSTAVEGKAPRASDAMSYAYRACIGMGDRSNRDGYPLDKKLEIWKKRVARARMMLPNGVRLRMWRLGEDVSDDCEAIVQEYLDTLKS